MNVWFIPFNTTMSHRRHQASGLTGCMTLLSTTVPSRDELDHGTVIDLFKQLQALDRLGAWLERTVLSTLFVPHGQRERAQYTMLDLLQQAQAQEPTLLFDQLISLVAVPKLTSHCLYGESSCFQKAVVDLFGIYREIADHQGINSAQSARLATIAVRAMPWFSLMTMARHARATGILYWTYALLLGSGSDDPVSQLLLTSHTLEKAIEMDSPNTAVLMLQQWQKTRGNSPLRAPVYVVKGDSWDDQGTLLHRAVMNSNADLFFVLCQLWCDSTVVAATDKNGLRITELLVGMPCGAHDRLNVAKVLRVLRDRDVGAWDRHDYSDAEKLFHERLLIGWMLVHLRGAEFSSDTIGLVKGRNNAVLAAILHLFYQHTQQRSSSQDSVSLEVLIEEFASHHTLALDVPHVPRAFPPSMGLHQDAQDFVNFVGSLSF